MVKLDSFKVILEKLKYINMCGCWKMESEEVMQQLRRSIDKVAKVDAILIPQMGLDAVSTSSWISPFSHQLRLPF